MKNIQVSANDREGVEQFKQIDMARYTTQTFSMFGGEAERLTLEFSNRLIGRCHRQVWQRYTYPQNRRKTFSDIC